MRRNRKGSTYRMSPMDRTTLSKPMLEPNLKDGLRVTWVGFCINCFLVIAKVVIGVIGKSQALIADGVHSLSDLFSDIIVLFGLRWGRKEEDADHPFGHARIETISAMLVGLILLAVGIGIAYGAIRATYLHQPSSPTLLVIIAAAFSIFLKEWLFWYTVKVGKRLKSPAIIGNAWHHRSDAFSSVAVLIGVTAAYLNPNWHLADAIAALVVTVFIVKVGVDLTWTAVKEVVDTAPNKEILDRLKTTAAGVSGVKQVHDMRARYSGSQILVEMHIVVEPQITVFEGHEIAAAVKYALLNEIDDVTRVIIHVDPVLK